MSEDEKTEIRNQKTEDGRTEIRDQKSDVGGRRDRDQKSKRQRTKVGGYFYLDFRVVDFSLQYGFGGCAVLSALQDF